MIFHLFTDLLLIIALVNVHTRVQIINVLIQQGHDIRIPREPVLNIIVGREIRSLGPVRSNIRCLRPFGGQILCLIWRETEHGQVGIECCSGCQVGL